MHDLGKGKGGHGSPAAEISWTLLVKLYVGFENLDYSLDKNILLPHPFVMFYAFLSAAQNFNDVHAINGICFKYRNITTYIWLFMTLPWYKCLGASCKYLSVALRFLHTVPNRKDRNPNKGQILPKHQGKKF